MGKFRTIDSFFKKNEDSNLENSTLLGSNVEASTSNERPFKSPRIDPEKHPSRSSVVEVELFYISYTHKKKKFIHGPPKYKFLAPPLTVCNSTNLNPSFNLGCVCFDFKSLPKMFFRKCKCLIAHGK